MDNIIDEIRELNLVPMMLNDSRPALNDWVKFQNKKFTGRIDFNGNYGYISGNISKSICLDYDLDKKIKHGKGLTEEETDVFYENLINWCPELYDTLTFRSKSGAPKPIFKCDFDIDFTCITLHLEKEFGGILLDHLEFRGNNHFNALYGKINEKEYTIYIEKSIKTLNKEEFEKLFNHYNLLSIFEETTKKTTRNNEKLEPVKITPNDEIKWQEILKILPPCLREITINNFLTHGTGYGHSMNRSLCNAFIMLGVNDNLIHRAFSTHNEYRISYTQYQIESLRRGYNPNYIIPLTCRTIRERGFCIECKNKNHRIWRWND